VRAVRLSSRRDLDEILHRLRRVLPSELLNFDKLLGLFRSTARITGLADPRLSMRFAELGDAVFPSEPADFAKLIVDDTDKWAKVIRAANIKPE
jgi:hypothetical protein